MPKEIYQLSINVKVLGQVVRKLVNVNSGLKVNWSIKFSFLKCFSPLMFGVV